MTFGDFREVADCVCLFVASQAGSDAKSPRDEVGGDAGEVGEVSVEEVMVFNVGDKKLALTHKKLLMDQQFFDFELHLGGQYKKNPPFKAHRAILQLRCPNLLQEGKFISKIEKTKKDNHFMTTINETNLPYMSPSVLNQIMKFVYSGTMDLAKFTLETLETVLDIGACSSALGMDEIVWLVEHKVREILNDESVHKILRKAADRKLEGVRNFTTQYAFAHWQAFVGSTTGAKDLGMELFQEVSAKREGGDKPDYPEGPQPENTIMADYKKLYEDMTFPDLTIEVGGEKLPCHRAVLAMYSDALAARFRAQLKPGQHATIKMIDDGNKADVKSASAVISLLRFVYYGENKMDPIDACDMIHKVNSVYKLATFQLLCEHTVVNNINSRSVIPIVGITYIKGFDSKQHVQALRKQALDFVIQNFATTDLGALASMPPEIRTDLLITLQEAYKTGKLGAAPAPGGAAPAAAKDEEEPVIGIEDDDL